MSTIVAAVTKATAPPIVRNGRNRAVAEADDADTQLDASDVPDSNINTDAGPVLTNPFIAAGGVRDRSASIRRPASDQLSTAPRSVADGMATVPLSWCFRAHGSFVWQEMNAGLPPQHSVSTDTNVVWQGSASARVDAANDSISLEGVGVMWQAVAAAPFRGKRVEVSAYARPRITRVGHFFVRTQANFPLELWLSDQGTPGARGINQYIPRDAEWDRYRVVHDVPADAEVMYYGFALFGGGHVWIDDVRISIVDEAQALSHYGSVKGTPNIAIDPTWVLPAPLNLDFELTSHGPSGGAEALHPDCMQPTN
jgi:hypothetical protein